MDVSSRSGTTRQQERKRPPALFTLCRALQERNPCVLVGSGMPRERLSLGTMEAGWEMLCNRLGGDHMPDGATVLVFGDVGPHRTGDVGNEGGTLGGVDLADVCNTLCSVWKGRHDEATGNTHHGVTRPIRDSCGKMQEA